MKQQAITLRSAMGAVASALVIGALTAAPTIAKAEEAGVSFWVPGFFGSLSATPCSRGLADHSRSRLPPLAH